MAIRSSWEDWLAATGFSSLQPDISISSGLVSGRMHAADTGRSWPPRSSHQDVLRLQAAIIVLERVLVLQGRSYFAAPWRLCSSSSGWPSFSLLMRVGVQGLLNMALPPDWNFVKQREAPGRRQHAREGE